MSKVTDMPTDMPTGVPAPGPQGPASATPPLVLEVTRGEPQADELAALLLVVAAAGAGQDGPDGRDPRGTWSDRGTALGVGPARGSAWSWRHGGR